ncbi:sulfur carrier protein ThiS [Aliikangiella marina]|uniref:sulfur carrier protein ThiS n=1 Tax=Aliikangiella marina TaxID=1712262 RepID=UPI00163DC611|nr:sulfur carrier protein ThiS [Aliikangiella marina]
MLEVVLNGEKVTVEVDTLNQLLTSLVKQTDKYAVAVNEEFVPKASYADFKLNNGDRVELVMPMSGG